MPNRSWVCWGVVLGFGLGGLFNGILLHQILQWHHLLSLVPGMEDPRTQIRWDGYFHALMFVIAVVGLWGVLRARDKGQGWGQASFGPLLIGFGIWHVADSVLSHWILGIHRIRAESRSPLLWDLNWFVVFGLVPLFVGLLLLWSKPPKGRHIHYSTLSALVVLFVAAGTAAWPGAFS